MKIIKYEMNRKNFALTYLGAIPIMMALTWPLYFFNSEIALVGLFSIFAISLAIMWISIFRRLGNIGKSKLWFLGIFVPFLNLYTLPMLFSYPPNVKEIGMDKKGYLIFFIVLITAIALMAISFIIDPAN
jgi:uncharacterized membrane protein YhaH (DUF805 family)